MADKRYRFDFRTLEEAELISREVAQWFPDPARAYAGLHELMLNAVEHGNLGLGYDDKTRLLEKGLWFEEIQRRLACTPHGARQAHLTFKTDARSVEVCVEDEGDGFDWRPYLSFAEERIMHPHGRGIAIAARLAFDALWFEGRGNVVYGTMKK